MSIWNTPAPETLQQAESELAALDYELDCSGLCITRAIEIGAEMRDIRRLIAWMQSREDGHHAEC